MDVRLKNTFSATGTGTNVYRRQPGVTTWTHQALIAGSGAISASLVLEATSDPELLVGWELLAQIDVSGTTSASKMVTGSCVAEGLRQRCTALGAGTTLTAISNGA